MKFSWKNFPEMLLTHDPKSEILKKAWKNFPRNPLSDHPVFGNIFQDLAIWINLSGMCIGLFWRTTLPGLFGLDSEYRSDRTC